MDITELRSDPIIHALIRDLDSPRTVLHWYDFVYPLPFQAHPEIPIEGIDVGQRTGATYTSLDREAKEAGLILRWPPRLPNTRAMSDRPTLHTRSTG